MPMHAYIHTYIHTYIYIYRGCPNNVQGYTTLLPGHQQHVKQEPQTSKRARKGLHSAYLEGSGGSAWFFRTIFCEAAAARQCFAWLALPFWPALPRQLGRGMRIEVGSYSTWRSMGCSK